MLLGRSVYGSGMETLQVALTTLLADWFDDSNLPFALSILVMAMKVSGVANSLMGPTLHSAVTAFVVGLGLCSLSCVCGIVVCLQHKRYEGVDACSVATWPQRALVCRFGAAV